MKIFRNLLIFVSFSICFAACSQKPEFTVQGIIQGSEGDTLYLERRNFNDILTLDSAIMRENGEFKFKSASPDYPDLYILRLNGQIINLSVDSIETITVRADKKDFASGYTVEGSDNSENLKTVVLLQNQLQKDITELKTNLRANRITLPEYNNEIAEITANYKDTIRKVIMTDLKSPMAYFALFQRVEGVLVLNPYEKTDSRIFSAVATAWNHYYTNTPRAKYLRDFTLNAINERRNTEIKNNMLSEAISNNVVGGYNISLPDIHDREVSLNELKGKVVLLDFTLYGAEYSPLHNMNLNTLYEKYKDRVEIYQVSFDADEHFWKNAAFNLPWISVWEKESGDSELFSRFNIQQLPTVFLLNTDGEIVVRLDLSGDIEKEVKKLL